MRPARPLLIAGPTASGKSAYALMRAAERPSLIINADSMQVYRDLSILTARPDPASIALAAHALYGHVDGAEAYSAGLWAREIAPELARAAALGLRPIIVGGTGLYFRALLEGLSPMPDVPSEIRERWRAMARDVGTADVYRLLAERDPLTAARLDPHDTQRIVRALEVLDATGRSLSAWQAEPGTPLLRAEACERRLVVVEREALNARADARFERMVADGALDEVAALVRRGLGFDLPVMRALGVQSLADHLAGRIGLDEAMARAIRETRAYIKRQHTWLKRNMISWESSETQ